MKRLQVLPQETITIFCGRLHALTHANEDVWKR